MAEEYREQFLGLKTATHLVGTLTTPSQAAPRLGVLLFNAGVIHRVGPHRVNVKLARALACNGMASLRLDLSGLGDSRRSGGTEAMLDQVRADLRAAVDELVARTGVQRVVLAGICSGAEYGYQYVLDDPRVTGLVMVDGYSFANRKTRFLRYALRLRTLTWPVLKKALQGRMARLRQGHQAAPDTPVDYGLPSITANEFGRGLAERMRKGVRILMIFTGSILQRYNHAGQFRSVMKQANLPPEDQALLSSGAVRCDFIPEIDHTLSTVDGQQRYITTLLPWLRILDEELRQPAVRR
ncbi:MAG: alpha/beta hydrolase [Lautropia sp.]|nr:alpha/beta hydrolase [Lautropia sp.]